MWHSRNVYMRGELTLSELRNRETRKRFLNASSYDAMSGYESHPGHGLPVPGLDVLHRL